MPQTTKQISHSSKTHVSNKDSHNPFPEVYQSKFLKEKKLPKAKKFGKCFQLMLICQKLLKPFGSSSKCSQRHSSKNNQSENKRSKSTSHISTIDRSTSQNFVTHSKVDASVQTYSETDCFNIDDRTISSNHNLSSLKNGFDVFEPINVSKDYWDLDIDSAIVGDYNSMSALSLDEHIDPLYSTIKMLEDGQPVETHDQKFDTPYSDNASSLSCMSTPKSGVYSQIRKSPNKDSLKFCVYYPDYYLTSTESRLNFEQIMTIRSQLGLSQNFNCDGSESEWGRSACRSDETPDIPQRNYGSSVINLVTKLRRSTLGEHSCNFHFPSNLNSSVSSIALSNAHSNDNSIYAPIWVSQISTQSINSTPQYETPASEPTAPKRASAKYLQQMNPNFRDDSSEDASNISLYSPVKKISYPINFSDKSLFKNTIRFERSYADVFREEFSFFPRVNSQVGVYQNSKRDVLMDLKVPLDVISRENYQNFDDKLFLQPLMERSCEEDYFKRDINNSLDCIHV